MEFSAELIINRIKDLCELKELEKISISPQVVSNWKSRNTVPKADDLYRIAKYLNVTMEWLLTGENPNTELPEDIQKSVQKMLTLTEKQREPINVLIDGQVNYWKNIDR